MRTHSTNRQTPRTVPARLALFALEDRLTPATAVPDFFSTNAGVTLNQPAPGVLANDSPDSKLSPPIAPLTATLVVDVPATAGTLTLLSDGSFAFVPRSGFAGSTQFQYRATDALGPSFSSTTTATIDVIAPAPTTQPDFFTTPFGVPLAVPAAGVLANDTVPNGFGPLTASLIAAPPASAGTLVLNSNGSFAFTPAAGFSGTTTFKYAAIDINNSTQETASITVAAAIVPPVVPPVIPPPPPVRPTIPTRVTLTAAGTGAGSPAAVKVFNADGSEKFSLLPFEASFIGGVRVAVGDFNGDGVDDIIVGAGAGGAPRVAVFDGATGKRLADFFAYEETFRGGVHVAAGDVNGDGRAEYVLGAGSIGGPRVRVLNFDGTTVADYFAYDRAFLGGVRVAAGDLDGDGRAEIVTAAGPSGGPDIRVFNGLTGVLKNSFAAREANYRGGLNVAVISANASRGGSIVVGTDSYPDFAGSALDLQGAALPGLTGSPSGVPVSADTVTADPLVQAFSPTGGLFATVRPYGEPYRSGVRVSGSRTASDGFDFAVAPAGGIPGLVKFLKLSGSNVGLAKEIAPFGANFNGSVYVGS